MSTAFLHTIVANNPFGAEVWDLTNVATELRLSNMSPGGHAEAEITYEDVDPLTTPAMGAILTISDKAGVYWAGRVEEIDVGFRPGGGRVKITGRGMASSTADQIISTFVNFNTVTGDASAQFNQGQAVRDAFRSIVLNLCPFVGWDDTKVHVGATLAGDTSQLYGKTPQECFNELATIGSDLGGGSSTSKQIFWNVYSGGAFNKGGTDNTSYMELIYKDQPVSYVIDMEDCQTTEISWQMKWIINRVSIQWADQQGNKGVATAIDPTTKSAYPNGIGVWRDHFVDATSHVSSQYEAQLMAESILSQVARIRPIGKQIVIQYPQQVADVNGNAVPLWRVLAGRMIQINNIDPNNPQLVGNEIFYIRETQWDEWNRTLTIMTEEVESIPQIVGKSVFQESTLPISTVASKVAIPNNPLLLAPGPDKGPGNQGQAPSGIPGQTTPNKGTAERNLSNIHMLVNGFETAIPDGQLGWVEVAFAGHITRLTGWATRKEDPNDFSPAGETIVEIYDALRNDTGLFSNRVLIRTLTITGGYTEDFDFDYIVFRDHVLIFKKVSGTDAEILCVSAQHSRDAAQVETDGEGVPLATTPSVTAKSAVAGAYNTVVVSWTTDVLSTGYVSWGAQTAQDNQGQPDDVLSKTHYFTIPSVAPSQTLSYIITAISKDGATSTTGGTIST